jgi:hypothetical protein
MSLNRNGFQTFVNRNPAPAVVGDFASMNPRASALAGEGAFRSATTLNYLSAPNNPVIGRAAWGQGQFAYGQKPAGASVLGFVANELQTVIPFLAPGAGVNPTRLAIESGFPTTLFTHGDFWAIPESPVGGAVAVGDTVYARQYDGALTDDPEAFAATGVQALTVLTVSAVTKGALVPGMIVDSSGADATVIAQLTGTPGGAGTYTVSTSATVGSGAITVAAVDTGFKWASDTVADAVTTASASIAAGTGVLTIGAMSSGTVEVGQNVSGTGVPANLFITAQLSGTPGGAGTYQTNTIGPAVATFTATLSQAKLAKISRTY